MEDSHPNNNIAERRYANQTTEGYMFKMLQRDMKIPHTLDSAGEFTLHYKKVVNMQNTALTKKRDWHIDQVDNRLLVRSGGPVSYVLAEFSHSQWDEATLIEAAPRLHRACLAILHKIQADLASDKLDEVWEEIAQELENVLPAQADD
jgi:hypothetical protein